jgi:hypothetical protein
MINRQKQNKSDIKRLESNSNKSKSINTNKEGWCIVKSGITLSSGGSILKISINGSEYSAKTNGGFTLGAKAKYQFIHNQIIVEPTGDTGSGNGEGGEGEEGIIEGTNWVLTRGER